MAAEEPKASNCCAGVIGSSSRLPLLYLKRFWADGRGPDVVAVAVVVARGHAELAEPVEDVRRVGAGEVELRLEGGDRRFGVGEGLGGALLDVGERGEQFGGVVGLARAGSRRGAGS